MRVASECVRACALLFAPALIHNATDVSRSLASRVTRRSQRRELIHQALRCLRRFQNQFSKSSESDIYETEKTVDDSARNDDLQLRSVGVGDAEE